MKSIHDMPLSWPVLSQGGPAYDPSATYCVADTVYVAHVTTSGKPGTTLSVRWRDDHNTKHPLDGTVHDDHEASTKFAYENDLLVRFIHAAERRDRGGVCTKQQLQVPLSGCTICGFESGSHAY